MTDRYVDSTLAYQGAGRDLADREVERVARWATGDLRPHLTVLLDLPPEQGLTRFEERDRIEAESVEFHERVREMFLQLAARAAGALPRGGRPPAGRGDHRRDPVAAAPLLDQATRRPVDPTPTRPTTRTRRPEEPTRDHAADPSTATGGVWGSLVGQQHAVAPLRAAVAGHGMTHAWLFTGPPGSGRSNVALAFAAALQCERGTGCGECHACRTALAGSHPDVSITRSETSMLYIDDMRELVHRSALVPGREALPDHGHRGRRPAR